MGSQRKIGIGKDGFQSSRILLEGLSEGKMGLSIACSKALMDQSNLETITIRRVA